MAKKHNSQYMKNVGRSMKSMGKDLIRTQMPTVVDTSVSAANTMSEFRRVVTTGRQSLTMAEKLQNRLFKPVQEVISNIKEDLRTGNYDNQDRELAGMMGGMDDLMSSMFDDEDQSTSSSEEESGFNDSAFNKVLQGSTASAMASDRSGRLIAQTSANNTEYLGQLQSRLNTQHMMIITRHHMELMRGMSNLQNIGMSLMKFNTETASDYFSKDLQIQSSQLSELQEIRNLINEQSEIIKKTSVNKNAGKGIKENILNTIFNPNGSINPTGFVQNAKNNIANMLPVDSSMTKLLFDQFKNNPIGMTFNLMSGNLIPGKTRKKMNKFDNAFGGIFSNFMHTVNNWMDNPTDKQWKKTFGNIFGVSKENFNPNLGIYKNQELDADLEIKKAKAITEVIPSYLSEILNSVSGIDKSFDYSKGMFIDNDVRRKQIRETQTSAAVAIGNRTAGYARNKATAFTKNMSSIDKDMFSEDMDLFHLWFMMTDFYKKKKVSYSDARKNGCPELSGGEDAFNLLWQIYKSSGNSNINRDRMDFRSQYGQSMGFASMDMNATGATQAVNGLSNRSINGMIRIGNNSNATVNASKYNVGRYSSTEFKTAIDSVSDDDEFLTDDQAEAKKKEEESKLHLPKFINDAKKKISDRINKTFGGIDNKTLNNIKKYANSMMDTAINKAEAMNDPMFFENLVDNIQNNVSSKFSEIKNMSKRERREYARNQASKAKNIATSTVNKSKEKLDAAANTVKEKVGVPSMMTEDDSDDSDSDDGSGNSESVKLTKNYGEIAKKYLPSTLLSSAAGGLVAKLFKKSPFLGSVIGAGANILFQSSKVQTFLFGDPNKEDDKGILGGIKDKFDSVIMEPLQKIMEPFNKALSEKFINPMKDWLNKKAEGVSAWLSNKLGIETVNKVDKEEQRHQETISALNEIRDTTADKNAEAKEEAAKVSDTLNSALDPNAKGDNKFSKVFDKALSGIKDGGTMGLSAGKGALISSVLGMGPIPGAIFGSMFGKHKVKKKNTSKEDTKTAKAVDDATQEAEDSEKKTVTVGYKKTSVLGGAAMSSMLGLGPIPGIVFSSMINKTKKKNAINKAKEENEDAEIIAKATKDENKPKFKDRIGSEAKWAAASSLLGLGPMPGFLFGRVMAKHKKPKQKLTKEEKETEKFRKALEYEQNGGAKGKIKRFFGRRKNEALGAAASSLLGLGPIPGILLARVYNKHKYKKKEVDLTDPKLNKNTKYIDESGIIYKWNEDKMISEDGSKTFDKEKAQELINNGTLKATNGKATLSGKKQTIKDKIDEIADKTKEKISNANKSKDDESTDTNDDSPKTNSVIRPDSGMETKEEKREEVETHRHGETITKLEEIRDAIINKAKEKIEETQQSKEKAKATKMAKTEQALGKDLTKKAIEGDTDDIQKTVKQQMNDADTEDEQKMIERTTNVAANISKVSGGGSAPVEEEKKGPIASLLEKLGDFFGGGGLLALLPAVGGVLTSFLSGKLTNWLKENGFGGHDTTNKQGDRNFANFTDSIDTVGKTALTAGVSGTAYKLATKAGVSKLSAFKTIGSAASAVTSFQHASYAKKEGDAYKDRYADTLKQEEYGTAALSAAKGVFYAKKAVTSVANSSLGQKIISIITNALGNSKIGSLAKKLKLDKALGKIKGFLPELGKKIMEKLASKSPKLAGIIAKITGKIGALASVVASALPVITAVAAAIRGWNNAPRDLGVDTVTDGFGKARFLNAVIYLVDDVICGALDMFGIRDWLLEKLTNLIMTDEESAALKQSQEAETAEYEQFLKDNDLNREGFTQDMYDKMKHKSIWGNIKGVFGVNDLDKYKSGGEKNDQLKDKYGGYVEASEVKSDIQNGIDTLANNYSDQIQAATQNVTQNDNSVSSVDKSQTINIITNSLMTGSGARGLSTTEVLSDVTKTLANRHVSNANVYDLRYGKDVLKNLKGKSPLNKDRPDIINDVYEKMGLINKSGSGARGSSYRSSYGRAYGGMDPEDMVDSYKSNRYGRGKSKHYGRGNITIKNELTTCNYKAGRDSISYIVIHYTGHDGLGEDTAQSNANHFKSVNRQASAHYFVDRNSIFRVVKDEDTAWHCGTSGTYYSECRNKTSIGIEMCCYKHSDGTYSIADEIQNNTAALTKYLMNKYGVPISNVIRHYDVTHKLCPQPLIDESKWAAFKNKVQNANPSIIIDTEPSSYSNNGTVSTTTKLSNIVTNTGLMFKNPKGLLTAVRNDLSHKMYNGKNEIEEINNDSITTIDNNGDASYVDNKTGKLSKIKNAVSTGWNWVKDKASTVGNAISTGWNWVKDKASKVWNFFTGGSGARGEDPDYYNQADPRWGNNSFGKYDGHRDTVADGGCGPTVAAMALQKLTGQTITPDNMARLAMSSGTKYDDGGTDPEFFNIAGEKYGYSFNNSNGVDFDTINTLKAGKPVILMGRDQTGTSPFGTGSHYVLANGIDSNGNVNILDPQNASNNRKFNIQDVAASTTNAITPRGRGKYSKKYGREYFGRGTTEQDKVVTEATKRIGDTNFRTGDKSGSGSISGSVKSMCLAWCAAVYNCALYNNTVHVKSAENPTVLIGKCANFTSGFNNVPLGALLLFTYKTGTGDGKNGHAGIYTGNGKMVHAWDGKIIESAVSDIASKYGEPQGYTTDWFSSTSNLTTDSGTVSNNKIISGGNQVSKWISALTLTGKSDNQISFTGGESTSILNSISAMFSGSSTDTTDGESVNYGTTTSLTGDEKTKVNTIYNALIKNGFSHDGAIAILANMKAESSFNTSTLGDNGTSYGLCQWHNERWDRLKSFCSSNGYSADTVEGQVAYLAKEMKDYGLYNQFTKAGDAKVLADVFVRKFEKPANVDAQSTKRQGYVDDLYAISGSGARGKSELKPAIPDRLKPGRGLSITKNINSKGRGSSSSLMNNSGVNLVKSTMDTKSSIVGRAFTSNNNNETNINNKQLNTSYNNENNGVNTTDIIKALSTIIGLLENIDKSNSDISKKDFSGGTNIIAPNTTNNIPQGTNNSKQNLLSAIVSGI